MGVWGFWFGIGFRVSGVGVGFGIFEVPGSGFRGSMFWVLGLTVRGFGVSGFCLAVRCLVFRVEGWGLGVFDV